MGKIQFLMTAHDNKMTLGEANILWNTTLMCAIEEPMGVFWSADAVSKAIAKLKNDVDMKRDTRDDAQTLLKKLYNIRERIEREADKKRGLPSSKELHRDSKIRMVLPGSGLFTSTILNNTSDGLVVSAPVRGIVPIKAEEWVHKTISIYAWVTDDAEYSFDTEVISKTMFFGKPALHLKHSNEMIRIQKRRTIRAKCKIYGSLYIITNNEELNFDAIETRKGYRCLIEDISEAGALIQIAGKGQPRVKIRIQFEINGRLVAMFGIVRTVEYNAAHNRSRLHFECLHINDTMRNHVLSYVYNMASDTDVELPDNDIIPSNASDAESELRFGEDNDATQGVPSIEGISSND